jgi:Mg-chelatase subunit ChlD
VIITTEHPESTFFIDASLVAVSAPGFRRNHQIKQPGLKRFAVSSSEPMTLKLKMPGEKRFMLGKYRVQLDVLGYEQVLIPFEVVQKHSNADLLTEVRTGSRFNVALRAFGATIVVPDKSGEEKLGPVALLREQSLQWSPINLIDGAGVTYHYAGNRLECLSCGWLIEASQLPADVVIRLAGERAPWVEAVVIEPYGGYRPIADRPPPDYIELAISETGNTDDFQVLDTVRLQQSKSPQIVRFEPVSGRFLRLRVLDASAERSYLGEVRVLEADEPAESVLADFPRNLASPDLGGVVVHASSSGNALAGSVDGIADPAEPGWYSGKGAGTTSSIFPQDIVFAFRGDLETFVDRVEINPANKSSTSSWVRDIVIATTSDHNPTTGYSEVGRFGIESVDEYQSLNVGRKARFIRLRVLSNNSGSTRVSLGDIRIIEASAANHDSILVENPAPSTDGATRGRSRTPESLEQATDQEPNDAPDQAVPIELDVPVRGLIEDLEDIDQYSLGLDLDVPTTLNLELSGFPGIRTAMNLFSPGGDLLREFDPGGKLKELEQFSWHLQESGNYRVELSQPPASIVLVWDASGSMMGSTDDLEHAVNRFLDGLQPGERVNLIRFLGEEVEVLLPGFSDNRDELRAAIDGKFIASGGTPLYDALDKAMELLSGISGNRAIILLSDGLDSTSKYTDLGQFWKMLAKGAPAQIHVIGLGEGMRIYSREFGTTGERQLKHIAAATGGQVLLTDDSAELERLYEEIAQDLRKPARYGFVASVSESIGALVVEAAEEEIGTSIIQPGQVALILDASGSMKRELDGERMIDTAKSVLSDVVEQLPDGSLVSLRVFGHRINEGQPGDCEDSEALVPFVPLDRALLRGRLNAVTATGGTTLITHSLRQVIADFGDVEGWKLVVLVTDGEEECEPDIASALAEAEAAGIDLSLNIVGFALAEEELKQSLAELAASTNGSFFDARNAKALRSELQQAIAFPFEIYDSGNALVGSGLVSEQPTELPAGHYTLKIQTAAGVIDIPQVEVKADSVTRIQLSRSGDDIEYELN